MKNNNNIVQAVYFDIKKQLFIVNDKNKEQLGNPTFLFHAKTPTAFAEFYKIFEKEYSKIKNEKHHVTLQFIEQCKRKMVLN
jgi:hypothetical protein